MNCGIDFTGVMKHLLVNVTAGSYCSRDYIGYLVLLGLRGGSSLFRKSQVFKFSYPGTSVMLEG